MAHYSNMNFFNGWDYNKIKMVYDVSVEYEYSIHNIVYKEVLLNYIILYFGLNFLNINIIGGNNERNILRKKWGILSSKINRS